MGMQYLNVKAKNLNIKEYRDRSATQEDCETLIDQDTTLLVDGKPVCVYIEKVPDKVDDLFDCLTRIKYDTTTRTSGLITSSKIFGYAPRNAIRNLPCRAVGLASSQPRENEILKKFADIAARIYSEPNQDLSIKHKKMTEDNVIKQYKMSGSMFTSGIVNHNNPLKYHFDTGNYIGVWSAMFAFKRDVEGGYLSFPEYGIALKTSHASLSMFDGQSILHGVTPIKKMKPTAVRYTIVYYSLKSMWSCETPQGEIERMRNKRLEIELSRRSKK